MTHYLSSKELAVMCGGLLCKELVQYMQSMYETREQH